MCTVSWQHLSDGYRLLCNRDEQRTRRVAIEPVEERRHGVRFLAPIDGDRGGTWLSVNEYGLALCLLNDACLSHRVAAVPSPNVTRGAIPLALVDSSTAQEACERLAKTNLAPFATFTLAIAEPGLPVALAEWNGAELAILPYGDPYLPLISSSFQQEAVRAYRQAEFRRLGDPGEFHRSHAGGPSAFSPCMHRDDAETVSHAQIQVTDADIILTYVGGPPCRGIPPVEKCLTRVQ